MPNKKINALDARTAVSTDLMLVGDPATGTAYKSTLANLPLVLYTGATGAVNLGAFGITAASLIKSGGTSSQFLKADGSVDSSTYTPTSRTLTINGTTQDLTADRTFTIATGISGSGVAGQLTYWNGTGSVTGNSALTYNGSTLVVGTSGNAIPSGANVARFVNNISGSDVEINGNGYARLFFNDYSRGADSKYYEMLNLNGDWKISRLNDLNTLRTERITIFGATGNVFIGSSPSDAITSNKLTVTGSILISNNQNASTSLEIKNTNNSSNAATTLLLSNNQGTAIGQVGLYSTLTTGYKILSGSDLFLYKGGINGDISFLNDNPSGKIKLSAGGSSTAQMTLTAAGRLLLGTVSESTNILEVNGTARVSGNFQQGTGGSFTSGISSTSSTTSSFIEISGASGNNSSLTYSKAGSLSTLWQVYTDSTNNYAIFRNGVNREIFKIFESTKNVGIDEVAATATFSDVASAKLFVNSTTKGFLPPRMTTTQINAIATPAEGLQVYNTTINHMCFYQNGAWAKISHSPM